MSGEVQPSGNERHGRSTTASDAAARRRGLTPDLWIVLAATAIGALLRFDSLSHQSYWIDEATTVHEIGLSFGSMLHAVAHNEATPPLYFACAWVWSRIFSPGEVGLRSFSAICGTLIIPVAYVCGRELFSRWSGAIAAALCALSPYLIWYSQEARAYILLALLCGLSLLFCARALRTGRSANLACWTLCSAAALATHFFAVLLVVPEGAWLLWRLRRPAAAVALGVILAVQGALMPLLLGDASHPLDTWIGGLPLHDRLQAIPLDFGASQLYRTSALRWGFWGAGALAVALIVLAWASTAGRRRGLALCTGFGVTVVGVPVVGALVGVDYLFSRNLTPAWIPFVLVVGGAAGAERARPLGALLVLAVAGLFVWADIRISGDIAVQRPDWRAVAATLGPPLGARAVLVEEGNIGEEPLSLYLRGSTFSYSGVPAASPRLSLREIDVVASDASLPVNRLPPGVRLMSYTVVKEIAVARFSLAQPQDLNPRQVVAYNGRLLVPASSTPSVLVQR